MAGIFGSKSQSTQTPAVSGLSVSTSAAGKAIPVVWGTTRIAPNLIWYANFQAHAHHQKVGKGGGGCFAAGTMVDTPTGPRAIESFAANDPVLCLDPLTGRAQAGFVVEAHVHNVADTGDRMVHVHLPRRPSLHVTEKHWIFARGRWIEAVALERGDLLTMTDGATVEVLGVEPAPDVEQVYNLTVSPNHSFYADGVLVHNGGSSKTTSYTYTADLLWGLAEGHVDQVLTVYVDKALDTLAQLNLTFFQGSVGVAQPPWSYLISKYPSQALGYSGESYVGANPYNLNDSANLPNINLEVQRILDDAAFNSESGPIFTSPQVADGAVGYLPPITPFDVNPDYVVFDIITNFQYGVGNDWQNAGAGGALDDVTGLIGNLEVATEAFTLAGTFYLPQTANAGWFVLPTDFNNNNLKGSVWPVANMGVTRSDGVLYTQVGSNPGPGQYTVTAETFNIAYGFASSEIGNSFTLQYVVKTGFLDYFYFTYFNKLWVSPAYTEQRPATDVLKEIADNTYAEFVWSAGYLQLRPRFLLDTNGNPRTVTPLFDLTDDDFLPNQSSPSSGTSTDPVQCVRTRISDQDNVVQLEYLDRSNRYATAIAVAEDQAVADRYGRRFSGSKTAHLFCSAEAANRSAQLQLQKLLVRNTYYFTTDGRFCMLDPMDIITLTDAGLGLAKQPVRIVEITENDDGTINFVAEEYLDGIGQTAAYALNQGQGFAANTDGDPGNVNAPIFFPYPSQLTNGTLQAGIAISGSNPNWGGADVYASFDNVTYTYVGTQTGAARMGFLTADFPLSLDPDRTVPFSVDLSESFGNLVSATTADADQAATLSYVTGEFFSYSTLTLTGPNAYTGSGYIRRGQYGSGIHDHPSGTPFTRVDDLIFQHPYTADQIGMTLYVKFVSFNVYGGGLQQLAAVTPYTWVIGSPFDSVPVSVTVNYAPDWLGTLSGFVRHYTGVLYPDSTVTAGTMTDAQLWDTFVYSPVAGPTFTGPTIDIGQTTPVTVTETSTSYDGPGVVGTPLVTRELDQWNGGASDPNIYNVWTNGSTVGEFFNARITEDTSLPAVISQFSIKIFT